VAPAVEPLAASATVAAPAPRRSRGLIAAVIGGVLVLASAGYMWTGSPRMASAPWPSAGSDGAAGEGGEQAATGGTAPHALGNEQVLAMIDKLSQRLKESPSDAEGWAMLARSYAVIGRHTDALPAYEKAVALRPEDASLLADHADALAVANKHELTGEPLAMINKALKIDPDNLKALSLAGTAAFNRKDYAGAVRHWEHIAAVAPAGSSYLPQVEANLAEARELGKLPPPAAPAASAAPVRASGAVAVPGSTVSGTVTLAAALRDRVAPTDTVFVFARAAEGPRMPLAILRKQVKDLPLDFKLDDSQAMSPAMRLSSYSKVVVGARVSKSGNAMPQPGDLAGQTAVSDLGASGLKIEISQAVAAP
jgi:cytochrome c-type biogenesis protein CcmH